VVRRVLQTLMAMAKAEALGRVIAHRDLKCCNLLLDSNGNVFVTDFGHSCCQPLQGADPPQPLDDLVGTPFHCHLDVAACSHGPDVDIWSLGVCVVEMLTVSPTTTSLSALGCTWSMEPGGQQQWVDWMQRLVQGTASIPECAVVGVDTGPASLRSFVGACCVKPTGSRQQKLAELNTHQWLQSG
jgi:serine/threonine protein kinase